MKNGNHGLINELVHIYIYHIYLGIYRAELINKAAVFM